LNKLKFGGILLANSNELENELRMFRIGQQRRTENKTVYIYIYIDTQKLLYRKKTQPSLQQTLLKTMSNVKVFELEVQVHNFIN